MSPVGWLGLLAIALWLAVVRGGLRRRALHEQESRALVAIFEALGFLLVVVYVFGTLLLAAVDEVLAR